MGIMTAITTTTIVITTKANPTGTTTAPTARRSTCIFEQMPVSELAVLAVRWHMQILSMREEVQSC